MARAICSSCGLRSQRCQCHPEVSTAGNANVDNGERASTKLTRASFWTIYLVTATAVSLCFLLMFYLIGFRSLKSSCHLEVFVDSFSISNVSNATADWNVSFVTRSPGNGCKISLHMIKSRLLRGGNLISKSLNTPDYFGELVTGQMNEPLSYAVFDTVETPKGNGGGVVWDLRVYVVSLVRNVGLHDYSCLESPGYLHVNCDGILVDFTMDSAGNVKGSLLGHMRPCEYLLRNNYTDTTF
ncbi:unnamed protein product [Eruca vesicaria subsp. sativa]|uniref:Uncharacterized protein n=1 Tax=Eruca vesicaria subsp. sativa TaxID=29727 RepID=A0ABC8M250_ERUVS|nr:unnamed protein product [Eruca vesicaria subsp. sativa]